MTELVKLLLPINFVILAHLHNAYQGSTSICQYEPSVAPLVFLSANIGVVAAACWCHVLEGQRR